MFQLALLASLLTALAGLPVPDICTLGADRGPCNLSIIRWFYDNNNKDCMPFIYGGCEGNINNFRTKEQCIQRCNNRDTCLLPALTSYCKARFIRWFHDQTVGECRTFVYGGCLGNRNNFKTQEECDDFCGNIRDV